MTESNGQPFTMQDPRELAGLADGMLRPPVASLQSVASGISASLQRELIRATGVHADMTAGSQGAPASAAEHDLADPAVRLRLLHHIGTVATAPIATGEPDADTERTLLFRRVIHDVSMGRMPSGAVRDLVATATEVPPEHTQASFIIALTAGWWRRRNAVVAVQPPSTGQATASPTAETAAVTSAPASSATQAGNDATVRRPGLVEPEVVGLVDPAWINDAVARAVEGDSRARDALLRHIQPLILKYCRSRMGRQESLMGSAEDVAQDVCLAVVTALPNYQIRGLSFRAFVYGIAAHKVTDAFRAIGRNRAEPVADLPDGPVTADGPEHRLLAAEMSARLGRLLGHLTPRQREILVLRLAVGLSAEETAQAVRSTPGAVRVTQHRALGRLRKILLGAAGARGIAARERPGRSSHADEPGEPDGMDEADVTDIADAAAAAADEAIIQRAIGLLQGGPADADGSEGGAGDRLGYA